MTPTGQCKKDFEKWLQIQDYENCLVSPAHVLIFSPKSLFHFEQLPFSMQYGVYVDFYGEKHFKITIQYHPQLDQYSFNVIQVGKIKGLKHTTHKSYHVHYNSHCDRVYYDTEKEARHQAIEKANEIYNNKVNNE